MYKWVGKVQQNLTMVSPDLFPGKHDFGAFLRKFKSDITDAEVVEIMNSY